MWHIHQGPSISFELRVVVGAIDDSLDFIHVGFPIYLSVWEKKQETSNNIDRWLWVYHDQCKEELNGFGHYTDDVSQ